MRPTYSYLQLIESCVASKSLTQAKIIHQHLLKNHLLSYVLLQEKLTHLYIICNKPNLAQRVFVTISGEKRSRAVIWNQMIRAYAWQGPYDKAIQLYYEMIRNGVIPTKHTYPFVLKACAGLKDAESGVEVHEHVKRSSLGRDVYVCTALVDFYMKCGWLREAREVFDGMPDRDVVAWNAMISGYSINGLYWDMINLVVEMQVKGVCPNSSTVVAILPAIGEANRVSEGKSVHGFCIRRAFNNDVVVGTGILDMYGKCGCLVYTRRTFGAMRVKNEVTWSAMIGACVSCDAIREGLELFERVRAVDGMSLSPIMLGTVIRGCAKLTDKSIGRQIHCYTIKLGSFQDLMVGNTLLSMYAKCGMINDAMSFFEQMNFKDSVSYNAIISGCVQNGNADEAFQTFRLMQSSKVELELETMMGLLPACSYLAALQQGTCGHAYSIVRGFTADVSICNALIDMYCKCGKVASARLVFDMMHERDVISWNAMIIGYGLHGLATEAISLFHEMQAVGLNPDEITFIGILSACSHSGLVDDGKHWFFSMSQQFSIPPRTDHYLCMVDLLGRAGLLEEACDLIQGMPFKPDVQVWGALLASCRIHKNIELAEVVSNKIQSLGPESTGTFVLLSNLYSTIGRWDDAAHIRVVQKGSGFNKSPGCSWIEVNGVVHAFVGGDQSHPQSAQINEKLMELQAQMKRLGYSAESSFVYQDVEDEEKEHILLYHSEKLAVAFGILNLNPTKPIFVTKNLRICVDCHIAMKHISAIINRGISLRDTSRFHHFKDGVCSCRDFW